MGSAFHGFETLERSRGQPTFSGTSWDLSASRALAISDRNLRRDLEDLATLSYLDSVLATGCTIVELTITKAFSVKLPYLVSSLTTVLNKRGD